MLVGANPLRVTRCSGFLSRYVDSWGEKLLRLVGWDNMCPEEGAIALSPGVLTLGKIQ
jgi:hypothetical protein